MKRFNIKKLLLVFFITIFCNIGYSQVSTYTFIDPCTKVVTNFSVPLQGGKTMIIFLDKVGYFDINDMSNGTFTNWVNQTYKIYRQTNPCSQQQGQVTQNQITTQIISGTIQSLVSSILSSNQSQSSSTESSTVNNGDGSNDAGNKDNKNSDKKKNKSNGGNNSQGDNGNGSSTQNGGQSQSGSGSGSQNGGNNTQQGNSPSTNPSTNGGSNNPTTGGSPSTQPPVNNSGQSGGGSSTTGANTKPQTTGGEGNQTTSTPKQEKGNEIGTSTTMNVDAHNDKGESDGSSSGSGNKGKVKSNPLIISSDITSAQNLNRTYTPIINISTGKSSMTGLSSYGITGMVWLNFEQFAISTKYTKIHYNKSKKLKFIHNFNLTGVYTYGNYLGFVGYSGILNGGKYGITGFNVSAAATVIAQDKSGYYSPSITAFYTRPFKVSKKLVISPEIYVISTPLVYSTKEKVSISDRYISGFIGSGFDYQISKRFKMNLNYKANMSTNPEFPILSFFLIGGKVNI